MLIQERDSQAGGTSERSQLLSNQEQIYVTYSGELGYMLQRQVSHSVGINSAGYFYPIQSELFYLEAVLLPFNN